MKIKLKDNIFFSIFILSVALMFAYKMIFGEINIFNSITGFLEVIKPLILAGFVAYILYIPVSKIEKILKKSNKKFVVKRKRSISITLVYLTLVSLLFLTINWFIPFIYRSASELFENIPVYTEIIINFLENMTGKDIEISRSMISNIDSNIFKFILESESSGVFTQIGKIFGVLSSLFDGVMTLILSIYILQYKEKTSEFIKKVLLVFTSEETTLKIRKYVALTNYTFYKFVTIQIIDGLIVGVILSIVLLILNVKYAIPLGFLIGLCNLIPFFGAIFAVGVAGIITLLTGGLSQAILLLIVVIILQQIDANILNPILLGTNLEINKILIIVSVIIGGAYFGVIGMFLAVPTVKVISSIIDEFLNDRLKNKRIEEIKNKKKIKLKITEKLK